MTVEIGTAIRYIELPGAGALDETKQFYRTAFGWTWTDYGPTYAAYEDGTITVGLSLEASPGPAHEPGAESAIGPLVLFETGDLQATEDAVGAAGGQIVSGPYAYPGGQRFHFRDPAGNILGVYQSEPAGS